MKGKEKEQEMKKEEEEETEYFGQEQQQQPQAQAVLLMAQRSGAKILPITLPPRARRSPGAAKDLLLRKRSEGLLSAGALMCCRPLAKESLTFRVREGIPPMGSSL